MKATELLNIEDAISDLKDIKEGKRVPNTGVCAAALVTIPNKIMVEMFESWEHFSGVPGYPVPSGDTNASDNVSAYYHTDRYDKNTEYGRMRFKLIDHCIEYLNKLLVTEQ